MKRKDDLVGAAMVAQSMVKQWSDEQLLSRTPESLTQSFGCTIEAAKHILKDELTNRRLNETKVIKESDNVV